MEERKDQVKKTWGNVEPGPLSEGEAASLNEMRENAAKCNVKPTNMDPEPKAGGAGNLSEERPVQWQQLSDKERESISQRKDGHPKNCSGK
jgi:hypothetical protein